MTVEHVCKVLKTNAAGLAALLEVSRSAVSKWVAAGEVSYRFRPQVEALIAGRPRQRKSPRSVVPDDFPDRLMTYRSLQGLTQEKMAERMGVAGKEVIWAWETRVHRPWPRNWKKFLDLEQASR